MKKKEFFSEIFRKTVKTDDPEYWSKVLSETLYRIEYYERRKCSCFDCQIRLEKLIEFKDKLLDRKHNKASI